MDELTPSYRRGRTPSMTPEQARAARTLVDDGTPVVEVARTFGVDPTTIGRLPNRAPATA